jgi:opacity protein-like surface antigen
LNISRHFSLGLDAGYMHAGSWFYDAFEGENCLHYSICDTITEEILAEGENELNLTNMSIGLIPKYYFYPGENLSLFLFAGLNINFTKAEYQDNEWQDSKKLGLLDPEDIAPWDPYLEKNTGLGVISGLGMEYDLNDKLGFYLSAGYHYIFLNKKNFKTADRAEKFHAINFQAGIRLSFLKSKKL